MLTHFRAWMLKLLENARCLYYLMFFFAVKKKIVLFMTQTVVEELGVSDSPAVLSILKIVISYYHVIVIPLPTQPLPQSFFFLKKTSANLLVHSNFSSIFWLRQIGKSCPCTTVLSRSRLCTRVLLTVPPPQLRDSWPCKQCRPQVLMRF